MTGATTGPAGGADAGAPSRQGPLHLRGTLLPSGERRDLWAVDGRLTFTPVAGATTVADGGWLVPGLADLHCHVGMDERGFAVAEGGGPDVPRMRAAALASRETGALLLRDAGSPVDDSALQQMPDLPRLVRAGRHIARTGRYIRGLGVEVDPADLLAEVAVQAAAGDGWVKVVGDWIDRSVGDLRPCWPDDVLAAAVARAHELGARVASHVFGEDALPGLIAAGIDTIEHGSGLTPETVEAARAAGCTVVPTLINVANFPAIADAAGEKFPTYAAHMRALHGSAAARIGAAYDAGLPVLAGTDSGGMLPHGEIVREIRALHEAGLPREAAVGAASWAARSFLGLPGLEEGAPADVVAYPDDPRLDLGVLAHPSRIVLRGAVVG